MLSFDTKGWHVTINAFIQIPATATVNFSFAGMQLLIKCCFYLFQTDTSRCHKQKGSTEDWLMRAILASSQDTTDKKAAMLW